jgi:hypothetical protein
MRVAVLSDTHIRSAGNRRLPEAVYRPLARAEVMLHPGDIMVPEVLEDLERFAPVHAVLGNNDIGMTLPERLTVRIDGVTVSMVHDAGSATGRESRMKRWFPDAGLVVYGHSHIPMIVRGHGQTLLNPGSPTDKRRQPHFTMATVTLRDGRVERPAIVTVDP